MNDDLKLKTVNGDTVWRGVSSEDRTRPGAQKQAKLPILDPKILSIKHPDFWLLSFNVWLPVLHDLFAPPHKFNFNTYWGSADCSDRGRYSITVCCATFGHCRRGSACRYDCLRFLVFDVVFKSLADKKKKVQEDRERLEAEMEQLHSAHEVSCLINFLDGEIISVFCIQSWMLWIQYCLKLYHLLKNPQMAQSIVVCLKLFWPKPNKVLSLLATRIPSDLWALVSLKRMS